MTRYEFNSPDGASVAFDVNVPEVSGVTFTPAPAPEILLTDTPAPLLGAGCRFNNVLTGTPTYAPYQRVGLSFNSPTKGLNPAVLDVGVQNNCLVLSCYKDDPTPDLLKPWLDKVAANARVAIDAGLAPPEAWLNFAQEINANKWRAAPTYRGLVARELEIVGEHPAAEWVTCVEKFAWFVGVTPIDDYWTGLCPGLLWDRYAAAGYTPVDAQFAQIDVATDAAAADAASAGREFWWGMGEMGVTWQKTSDPSGQVQADTLSSYAGNRTARGARVMIVWDGPGEAPRDFTCSPPARSAWRGLCAASVAAG
jgi:hypothetical protein